MKYLILGANGYVGGYLYNRMKMEGLEVTGTGHCIAAEGLVYFDACKESVSDIAKKITGEEKTAILCIAQSNIDRCKTEYESSRRVNVETAKEMVGTLAEENYHVIYFSTDNVFDGMKGNYSEKDTTNAINEYGKMKEEMEHFLRDKYPEVCIFRLPKVLSAEREIKNMLADWEQRRFDNEIRCIKGMRMSVVAKDDLYQACLIAAERKMQGIYHLSSGEIYSRKELAAIFFERLGVGGRNIVELDINEFGFQDKRPLDIGLDNSKFRKETGFCFKTYAAMVEQYLEKNS